MITTVYEHAARIAENVARGAEVRDEYAKVIRDNDLTLGACAALRTAMDAAIVARLRDLRKVADSLRIG